MSASDRSTPSPGRSGEDEGEAAPGGARLVAAALIAAAVGFLAVLALSVWLGVRFGFARLPRLEVMVQARVSGTVQLLSALLEGASGVLTLGAVSAALLAAGCGAFAERPARRALTLRLRRLWRDLLRLSRDAARWVGELPRRRGGWHVAALAAVVAGGAALRLLYLSQPVRYDEAFTFTHFASEPAVLGLSRYTYPNNHLLHTLLVRLVTSAVGTAPAAMRIPAFLAGVGVVPAAYAAWDALGDADEALVAAAVAAVSTPLVLYSTNARGYTIVVLGGLLLVPLAARLLRRRDLAAWGVFCVVSAASLHAIPIALYPVGAALIWLILSGRSGDGEAAADPRSGGRGTRSGGTPRRPRSRLLRESGAALLVVGVAAGWLYMPAIQLSGLPSIVANRFVAPSPLGEFAAGLPGFFASVWSTWTAGWPTAAAVALGVLALLGVGRDVGLPGDPGRGSGVASYPVAALAWSLLLLLVGRRVPFARVWLFLAPVFGLLVARGTGWALGRSRAAGGADAGGDGDGASGTLRGRAAGPVAAALLLAGLGGSVVAGDAVVESPATNPYRDGEEVARLLQERMEEDDGLLAFGPAEVVLEYWFQHLGMSPDRVNLRPEAGGRLYVVVHEAEGQTLPEIMAKLGAAGSRRTRTRPVAEMEHSTLYAVEPAEEPESAGSQRGVSGEWARSERRRERRWW